MEQQPNWETRVSRRQILSLAAGSAMALILPACGSGGGSKQNFGVLQENVVVLPSDGSVTLTNITDTSVTLSGGVPPGITAGSVIVSGEGAGLLRKVVSVSGAASAPVLTTEQGTLTDLFKDARIAFKRTIGASDIVKFENQPGVTGPTRAAHPGRASVKMEFSYEKKFESISFDAKGEFSIEFEFELNLEIEDSEVKSIQFSSKMTGESSIKGSCKAKKSGEALLDLTKATGSPIIVWIGPVPVPIIPTIGVKLKCEGSLQGGFQFSAGGTGSVEGSVSYSKTSGFGYSSDSSYDKKGVSPGRIFGSIKVGASIIAEPELSAFGVIGPSTELAWGPEAEIKASGSPFITLDPPSLKVKVEHKISAKPKLSASIFSKKLVDFKPELSLEKSWTVYERSFVPGSAEVGVN